MSNRNERRSLRDDIIEDIVDPSPRASATTPISSFVIDSVKISQNQNYSSLPLLFNKPNDHRDRSHHLLSSCRNSSSLTMSNDERRKEIDLIIKHLYDGKLLTATTDDRTASDNSEPSIPTLSRRAIITTTTATTKTGNSDEESKTQDVSV